LLPTQEINDDVVELSHDSLAEKIANKRTPEELRIIECEKLVRIQFSNALRTNDFLSRKQIEYIEPVFNKLKLSEEESVFFSQSKKYDDQLKRKERRRRKAERVLKIGFVSTLFIGLGFSLHFSGKFKKERDLLKVAESDLIKKEAILDASNDKLNKNNKELKNTIVTLNKTQDSLKASSKTIETQLEELNIKTNELLQKNKDLAVKDSANLQLINEVSEQRNIADQQKERAIELQYQTAAINYAYKSEVETDSSRRKYRALQAYLLNKKHNDNAWKPEIINALLRTDVNYHGDNIIQNDTAIFDISIYDHVLYFINGTGNLYEYPMSIAGNYTHIYNAPSYMKQSLLIQKETITFVDAESTKYILAKSNQTNRMLSKEKIQDFWEVKMEDKNILLFPDSLILQRQSNKEILKDLSFNHGQKISCFLVGIDKSTLVVGTNKGWLFLYDLKIGRIIADFQYYSYGIGIADIAMDEAKEFVATAGLDGIVKINKIHEVSDQKPIEMHFNEWVTSIEFINSESVIVGTNGGAIIQFDINQDNLADHILNSMDVKTVMLENHLADSLLIQQIKSAKK
jgi:WD40 repeat protein